MLALFGILALLLQSAVAVTNLTAPETVAADSSFGLTFSDAGSDKYQVFLAVEQGDSLGPTCFLQNSTTISSPLNLTIPAQVGLSGNNYAIGLADLMQSGQMTYSNRFNFTGGVGNYTQYEQHLGGAPFWDASALPCDQYTCVRRCAQTGYPDDLTDQSAWEKMDQCILQNCPSVKRDANQTGPANPSATFSAGIQAGGATSTSTGAAAGRTLAAGIVGLAGLAVFAL